ncbi:ebp domain-containing protein [Colletotrichum chrysophilum]|uniref:Ebp domain-containing protein n=1 Tax=Colletotrichum chrysophilum TaxID=1836956 RepID=A0AAD9A6R7_9PEZI|nr:ebp domain-containing protein [Colletotrichum chrysophilum]
MTESIPHNMNDPAVDFSANVAAPAHPYYPVDAQILHYTANQTSIPVLLIAFGAVLALAVGAAVLGARKAHPALSKADLFTVAWFALCGFLHCFFEGYFILYHENLASLQTFFGQLWKEYALSDSRYLTSDSFMLCVEGFTVAVWGPLCWSIVVAIAKRSTLRYPLTIIMCVGHLYGVVLYYSTSLTEYFLHGVSHSRPEFLYFWVYYIGFNGPWVVVPTLLLFSNAMHIKRQLEKAVGSEGAFEAARSVTRDVKKNE